MSVCEGNTDICQIESDEEDEEHLIIEYSTKENTRRIKRSHEKKEKKRKIIEESDDDGDDCKSAGKPIFIPVKKDNTRRGRREIVPKEMVNKHVRFEKEEMPKTFRMMTSRMSLTNDTI